jgi:GT2 family glycosyltransferase
MKMSNHTPTTTAPQATSARVIAVVVTYNRLEKLRETLTRLLHATPEALSKIVVVDNASTDGTREWLTAQTDTRLHTLLLEDNIGGAGGFDRGMRCAFQELDADWVVVMDDDARPDFGALEQFISTPPVADAVAAAVRYPNGTLCEMNRPSINPFADKKVFLRTLMSRSRDGYHISPDAYETSTPTPIDQTSFVGLFIPRKCVEAIGYPDPSLFIYGDDVIYTMSIRKAGFSIAFDPLIRFEHDCMTFGDDAKRKFSPLWKAYYAYRNGLIMYRKASGPILFWPLLCLVALKWTLSSNRYGSEKKQYFRILRAALRDGVLQDTYRSFDAVKALAKDQ